MYKLKNSYIDKMIEHKLSSCEIDFILYIARYQDEAGCVESVYYKDVCEKISISIQKFYDIIESLKGKGLILAKKSRPSDIKIVLIGNSFEQVDFEHGKVPGYLNVAQNQFSKDEFREMKAGSKLLYLYSQRFLNGKHMLVENFYNDFCRIFQVSKKTLQYYVHELKEKKLLFISRKRNQYYHYEMTMKPSTVLFVIKDIIPNEKSLYEDNIVHLIERNFKNYLPEPVSGYRQALHQIAGLATQQRASEHSDFVSLIVSAIKSSLLQQKKEKKDNPVINAALVNKWLSMAVT